MKIVYVTRNNRGGKTEIWWHLFMIQSSKKSLIFASKKHDHRYQHTLHYLLNDDYTNLYNEIDNIKFYENEDQLLGGVFCQK